LEGRGLSPLDTDTADDRRTVWY